MKDFIIADQHVRPGEFKEVVINIARLPSRTQIDTPVYIYHGTEPGPVLAMTAGMHGDEINGMEIVRRIIDGGHNRVQRGTTVCMPIINVYGFLNYSREVPDGKDVNRSFPDGRLARWLPAWPTTSRMTSFRTLTSASTIIPVVRCAPTTRKCGA